ncbi:hypothetical protein AK812_SmicGene32448 [Symbiodinium microadriaticum]|uniref:Uncharacterized protein n=1 Tax=Symbiodinium microadriaticum TaxID=2951 RepID=A0A1Q9CU21_SYMMI|nr:hypothetical protein AK812_SmicGene32448 [Symbiodinium microadriaticum]
MLVVAAGALVRLPPLPPPARSAPPKLKAAAGTTERYRFEICLLCQADRAYGASLLTASELRDGGAYGTRLPDELLPGRRRLRDERDGRSGSFVVLFYEVQTALMPLRDSLQEETFNHSRGYWLKSRFTWEGKVPYDLHPGAYNPAPSWKLGIFTASREPSRKVWKEYFVEDPP